MKSTQIKTIDDLGDMITEEMSRLRNKQTGVASARAMASLAGKAISVLKYYLEVYKLNGHELDSNFLDIAKILNSEIKRVPEYNKRARTTTNKNNGGLACRN